MELIGDKKDLLENAKQLDEYLNCEKDPENSFALDLVKKGVCFVAIGKEDGYRFYPSRFIGCKNNTMNKYLTNELKAGKEINPVISELIGCKPCMNVELDQEYKKYCGKLGFNAWHKGAFGVERKYWLLEE